VGNSCGGSAPKGEAPKAKVAAKAAGAAKAKAPHAHDKDHDQKKIAAGADSNTTPGRQFCCVIS
jgi:hypothetical protein